jgi:outer membrane PBP1 activator LpoA protein
MDLLESLALARRITPRLVSLLILAAVIFAPRPTASLMEGAAEARAQQVVALLDRALESTLESGSGHRHSHRSR